ncbi:Tyrosinase-like protein orsC [Apiospora rasikravindrae]|uniref:Tyrosinase-like protein orsC n=1 Tax=Apiospora rasikravindrae TaxID=990691 RepID=A0ABR1T5P3_9PEZI
MELHAFSFGALAFLLATAWLPNLVALAAAVATPSSSSTNADAAADGIDSTCTKPYVRKEWRRLTLDERKSYIGAVKCMMAKPGVAPLDAVTNRFEDFLATHIVQAFDSHFVGIFYPYHRFLLSRYEQELWDCGWNRDLGQPFWDWTLDVEHDDDLINSPVFDVETGFGGNGGWVGGNYTHPAPGMVSLLLSYLPYYLFLSRLGCSQRSQSRCLAWPRALSLVSILLPPSSPTLTNTLGPVPPPTPPRSSKPRKTSPTAPAAAAPQNNTEKKGSNCVRRDLSPVSLRNMSGPARVAEAMDLPDYGQWERVTDGMSLHPGGHWGPGGLYGTMTDLYASPGDPVFWLHHSNLDRAWWSWQTRDTAHIYDISGPLVFFDYSNKAAGNLTLDGTVWNGLGDYRKETTVERLMHIQRGELCYTYDELY